MAADSVTVYTNGAPSVTGGTLMLATVGSSVIVPMPKLSVIVALVAAVKFTLKVSAASVVLSSKIGTRMVFTVSPGAKVIVVAPIAV